MKNLTALRTTMARESSREGLKRGQRRRGVSEQRVAFQTRSSLQSGSCARFNRARGQDSRETRGAGSERWVETDLSWPAVAPS
jgi:hypothetical protein